ncbi:MAG: response regulator [Acidobacteriales bacterium]|nr:response regulator [Terriglobales bacterium]
MIGGRILVVEDEPALLRILVRYLTRLGFVAVAASCGRDAIEAFDGDQTGFSAVLTDLLLPDMRGEDLVVRLRKSNPAIAVLLTSGSPSALESLPLLCEARVASLAKPFTAKMLADALGQLLDRPNPPQPI